MEIDEIDERCAVRIVEIDAETMDELYEACEGLVLQVRRFSIL